MKLKLTFHNIYITYMEKKCGKINTGCIKKMAEDTFCVLKS